MNMGEDGSELSMSDFRESDMTIFAGAWSGGSGFYFDTTPSEGTCSTIGAKVRTLVGRTNGRAGEGGIDKLPPSLRRSLSSP